MIELFELLEKSSIRIVIWVILADLNDGVDHLHDVFSIVSILPGYPNFYIFRVFLKYISPKSK